MPPINEAEVDWEESSHGKTAFRRKRLAVAATGDELGCSLYSIPPGNRSWPYHYHAGNEEALYVLSGEGTLRLDGETYDLRAGDYVPFPADESGAHQLANESSDELRVLLISTMVDPDVTVYPDSGKIGVYTGSAPGADAGRDFTEYHRREDAVDYWDGEPGDARDDGDGV